MPTPTLFKFDVIEDSAATILARVSGNNGVYITIDTISSIACAVYEVRTEALVTSPTVTVATSVFDTLQTDDRWTEDTTGFNFAHEIPGSAFPDGNKIYQVEYTFTPVSGNPFRIVCQCTTLNLLGS